MGARGRDVSAGLPRSPILGLSLRFRRRDTMFRKHFRFRRRLLVGLAFAALAAPAAAQAQSGVFVDGGPVPVSTVSVSSYTPLYLRYHEVGVPVATGPQARSERGAQLTAETKRFLAMAKATEPQLI